MAFFYYSSQNKPYAQALRRNMTKQERHLWYDFLSSYPVRFRRQKQIGPFIVDFYCSQARLVLELDGSQHFSEEGQEYDKERDAYLESHHLLVFRIPNNDIDRHFTDVCERIDALVNERT